MCQQVLRMEAAKEAWRTATAVCQKTWPGIEACSLQTLQTLVLWNSNQMKAYQQQHPVWHNGVPFVRAAQEGAKTESPECFQASLRAQSDYACRKCAALTKQIQQHPANQ